MLFQFLDVDEHQAPPAPPTPYPRRPRMHTLKSKFSGKQNSKDKGRGKGCQGRRGDGDVGRRRLSPCLEPPRIMVATLNPP
jgi:hypothetical protein